MPLKKCSLFVFLVLQRILDQRVSGFCERGLRTVCRVVLSHSSAFHNLATFHVRSLDALKTVLSALHQIYFPCLDCMPHASLIQWNLCALVVLGVLPLVVGYLVRRNWVHPSC